MHLSYFIARRYLFAKKSHNVINIISLISAIGIAVGSCALIIVLSIYNGFEDVVRSMYNRAMPDIAVTCDSSKYFRTDTDAFCAIRSMPQIASFEESIEETVFLTYDMEESTAMLKGVSQSYADSPEIQACIEDGEFILMHGDVAKAVVGRSLAVETGMRPRFLAPIEVYFPARDKEISLVNPAASLNKETFFPSGIFFSGNESYSNTLFVSIDRARRLTGLDSNEAGKVEIRLTDDARVHRTVREISSVLGPDFSVKDKYMQNETVYRMMRIEKAVIFMILLFIIIVVSCNVFGSLTMLIIEKRDDIAALQYLGARKSLIQRIFFDEGWMIVLLGTVIGMTVGIALCLIQQYVGVIRMPGNFVVEYYPVVIKFGDIIATLAGIALIGLVITALPTRKTLSRIL
ncbi:MAG TPA: FtsX-like permease family protein [Candidatus Coprenecus pullistercoris]|nr:FtsX-like permease family protein [Candidatus Coprenecus pullistercoris]